MARDPIPTRTATRADAAAVAGVLARAFVADPVMAYLFPDAASRVQRLQRFYDLIVRAEADPADWTIAGDDAAATIWRPPGKGSVPTATMLRLAWPMLRAFGSGLPRALRLQALLDVHHPAEPHWYLAFAGCVPEQQGRGFGGAAIRAKLAAVDAARLPAGLETATETNLGLYGALGFRVTGRFDFAPGQPMWTMWREAVR